MKKLFLLLLVLPFLASCDDDIKEPTKEPLKGDAVTTEQIVGTYKSVSIKLDNTDDGLFKEIILLTFNADNTGEEFNFTTQKKHPFTWTYSDRIITFSYTLHKNVKGWFDKSELKYRDYYTDPENSKTQYLATFSFSKQ